MIYTPLMWSTHLLLLACFVSQGCCPCSERKPFGSSSGEASTSPPPGSAAGSECAGDMANSELPCTLSDGRFGWCKQGRCKDVCPAGFSYSPLDTQCHKSCGSTCAQCMDNVCLDDSTTRPMLEQ